MSLLHRLLAVGLAYSGLPAARAVVPPLGVRGTPPRDPLPANRKQRRNKKGTRQRSRTRRRGF